MTKQILTQEIVKELLRYNPVTGEFIWNHRGRKWFRTDHEFNRWNTRYAESRAGTNAGDGYLGISVFKTRILSHRLAWFYIYGEWPDVEIDHINHDRSLNAIANLRSVSKAENTRNATLCKNNTSGHVGVTWNKAKNKWTAQIRNGVKPVYLGAFIDKIDAIAARKQAEKDYGFHPNHGIN